MSNKQNYHCFICDLIYYQKEKLWLDKNTFIELELSPEAISGIYHYNCIDKYVNNYLLPNIPEQEIQPIISKLEEKITELKKKNEIKK